jgi:hypothetical protein
MSIHIKEYPLAYALSVQEFWRVSWHPQQRLENNYNLRSSRQVLSGLELGAILSSGDFAIPDPSLEYSLKQAELGNFRLA